MINEILCTPCESQRTDQNRSFLVRWMSVIVCVTAPLGSKQVT